jgi:hypothetical protein
VIEIGVLRGEDQDRHAAHAADLAADREAVFAGQQQIQQHEPRLFLLESFERAIAARLDDDAHRVLAEIGRGELRESRVVFDEQDVGRGAHKTSQT